MLKLNFLKGTDPVGIPLYPQTFTCLPHPHEHRYYAKEYISPLSPRGESQALMMAAKQKEE